MTDVIGQNWETEIQRIVEERLGVIGVESYADKYTGEIDQGRFNQFEKLENTLRKELFRRLEVYRKHATAIRKQNNMRPFSWALETVDRIEQYVHVEPWQLPKIRVYDDSGSTELTNGGKQHEKKTRTVPKKKASRQWRGRFVPGSVKTRQRQGPHTRQA